MLTSLFLLIVVGNGCVLLSLIYSENGIKTRMNFFILHLAIAGDVGKNSYTVISRCLIHSLFFSLHMQTLISAIVCILLWNIDIPCLLVFFSLHFFFHFLNKYDCIHRATVRTISWFNQFQFICQHINYLM